MTITEMRLWVTSTGVATANHWELIELVSAPWIGTADNRAMSQDDFRRAAASELRVTDHMRIRANRWNKKRP